MGGVLEQLVQESERLLSAIQGGARGEALAARLEGRQARLIALAEAVGGGETISADEAAQLRALDEEILGAMHGRRSSLLRQMNALYQKRSLHQAYRGAGAAAPAQFVDRAA